VVDLYSNLGGGPPLIDTSRASRFAP